MNVDVVALMRELGFSIAAGATKHSWLIQSSAGDGFQVHLAEPVERLTAHAVRHAKRLRSGGIRPLLAGRTATPGVIEQAGAGELDILLEEPLQLILSGRVFQPEKYERSAPAQPRRRRQAWTRRAVERCLLLAEHPLTQTEIADLAGTSQQSVSNACRQLGSMVASTNQGVEVRDPETLLKHWTEKYSGAGGQEFGWYSLDPIVEQTLKAVEVGTLLDVSPLVSGDVAADRLAPWKLPTHGRIYADGPVDLAGDGFVPAPLNDATLVICVPRDPTLWKTTAVGNFPVYDDVKLADPAVVYWDVRNSNDIDSLEAANHLAPLIRGHFSESLDQNQNERTERG